MSPEVRNVALAVTLGCVALGSPAQPVVAVPDFADAYRAWEVVSEIARHNRAPALTGECGKRFQPYVVPALRRQTRAEQDAAAVACAQQARALCANSAIARAPDTARKCEDFK